MAEIAPMKQYRGSKKMPKTAREGMMPTYVKKDPVAVPKPRPAAGKTGLAKEGQMPTFVKPYEKKSKQKKDFTR